MMKGDIYVVTFDGTVTITDREPDDSYNVKMDIRVID